MTSELYVIGSIVVAMIVVATLSASDPMDDPFTIKCPRCGAAMEDVGSGMGGCVHGGRYDVVPRILVLRCPQCGYSKRSWA